MYIELKFGKNKATKAQEEYMAMLNAQGYKTAVCYGADEAKAEIMDYLQDPDKMPLSKCLNAPWINGRCDGVPVVGHMFSREPCRNCEKHAPTKAEATLEANMAAVDGTFKRPIITAIVNLSTGEPLKGLSPVSYTHLTLPTKA